MAGNDDEDNERAENGSSGNRNDIGGDAFGPVVAGNHNMVIGVDNGSTLAFLLERERPEPKRRERADLPPRRRRQGALLGRENELEQLRDALRTSDAVQLWGPAGVGKSALLRHAAHELPGGRDGVLFLDAAGREPEDLAQDLFEACYESQGYAPSRTELRRLMADFEVTVYVDNATYTPEQLGTLMEAAPNAAFVFATRKRTLLGDGTALRLQGIDWDAAQELLARELGRSVTTPDQRDTAAALWATAHGRPLLLLRAAALSRLDPAGESVLPKPGAVAELLPLLLDSLDDPSIRALHLLATLGDAELAPEHIGALSDAPDPAALCANLVELGLTEESEGGGCRLVTDVIPELGIGGGPRPVPVDRLCDHFATWIARPTTTPADVARHARALEAVAGLAERAGRPELAVQVVRAASPALARSLRFGVWGRLLDQGLPAAQQAGDRQAEAYFTHERGIRAFLTGNRVLAGTLLAEAAVLWRLLGDTHGVNAASAAQQYVPQPSPSAPHTDGGSGGQALGNGPGTDPSSAAHGGTSPGVDPSASAAHGGTSPGVDPSASAAHGGTSPSVDPSAAHGVNPPSVDPSAAHSGVTPGPDPSSSLGSVGSPPDPASVHGAASHVSGMPADPTSAVPHAFAAPPPGVGEAGSAVAHSAAAGAGAAPASAGAAAALKVVAAIAALVIGGVAVDQYQAQQTRDDVNQIVDTPTVDTETYDPGLYEDEPTEEPTEEPTGLAGVWSSSEGGVFEFVETGWGSYTTTGEDPCGNSVTSEFTGSGDTYTGTAPGYDESSDSCESLGEVRTTITIDPDGQSAEATTELASAVDDTVTCTTCSSFTLTRES